jgi:hypothetical protein
MREYEHIYYILTMLLNIRRYVKVKTVPLHATQALGWRGGIALTHSTLHRETTFPRTRTRDTIVGVVTLESVISLLEQTILLSPMFCHH